MSDGGPAPELSVEFDGIDVLEIVSATDTETVVKTPAHIAGLVDVKVDNSLTSDTVDDGYLYYDELKITSISPDHGLTDGGTTVTITGVNFNTPTLPMPTTMQQMTQEYCESMPIYDKSKAANDPNNIASTVTLTDTRNGQAYDIRRLQDGKCWMIDNLKLELYTGMVLTPDDTNVVNNTTISLATSGLSGNFTTVATTSLTQNGTSNPTNPNFDAWRQVNPSNTTYCLGNTNDSLSGSGVTLNSIGSKTGCGYLYNWYTAVAGSATQTSHTKAGNTAQSSICPAGWRLPHAYSGTTDTNTDVTFTAGDPAILNASMQANTLTTPGVTTYGYYANWYPNGSFRGVPSAYWDTNFNNQGSHGYFWSSSAGGSNVAQQFRFFSGNVNPGDLNNYRSLGMAVRCVADGIQYPTVTIDGIPATVKSHNNTTIVVETPPHAAGKVNVVVSNALSTDTKTNGYEYTAPYLSISADSKNVKIGGGNIVPSTPNIFASSPNTVSIRTNQAGYDLTISTTTINNNLVHTTLAGTNITPTTGSFLGTKTALGNNTWGFTLDPAPASTNPIWSAVPGSAAPVLIKSTSVPNETIPGDQTTVHFGTKITWTQPAGSYQTTVLYTAVGK
jgi:uncharacterized protein (TIGR02145 family)